MPGRRGVLRPMRDAAHAAMPMEGERAPGKQYTPRRGTRYFSLCDVSGDAGRAPREPCVLYVCCTVLHLFYRCTVFSGDFAPKHLATSLRTEARASC